MVFSVTIIVFGFRTWMISVSEFFSTSTSISSPDTLDRTRLLNSYAENMYGRSYGLSSRTSARPALPAYGPKLRDIVLMAFSNNFLFPGVHGIQYQWISSRSYLFPPVLMQYSSLLTASQSKVSLFRQTTLLPLPKWPCFSLSTFSQSMVFQVTSPLIVDRRSYHISSVLSAKLWT